MGQSPAISPGRWSRFAALAALCASFVSAAPTFAVGAPSFIAEVMPPATCLASPDRACLAAAFDTVVSRFENRSAATRVASLKLFMAVERGLDHPAVDALLVRYDPNITADRLGDMRETARRNGARAVAPTEAAATLPARSELPAERARIVAVADRRSRVMQASTLIGGLIAARRFDEAEDLLGRVLKSLQGPDSSLPSYLAQTSARAFGAAGEWPAWSRSLAAAGFGKKMAAARTTSEAEEDPTEFAVAEPLRQGIPVEHLLPWIARAKDGAFRDALLKLMADAAFERGRAAAWQSDIDGFRRHVVDSTSRGELLRRDPDNRFEGTDEALLRFCQREANARADRGLALAGALQSILKPPSDDTAFERDRFRERVMDALASAMIVAGR